MPRCASHSGSRILEWFVLETRLGNSDATAVLEQTFAIRRYQVRHRTPLPDVTVQPEAAVHGVDHPFTSRAEFAVHLAGIIPAHLQATSPLTVAGDTGAAAPMKIEQRCGYDSGLFDVADQPTFVASLMVTTFPCDVGNPRESRLFEYWLWL